MEHDLPTLIIHTFHKGPALSELLLNMPDPAILTARMATIALINVPELLTDGTGLLPGQQTMPCLSVLDGLIADVIDIKVLIDGLALVPPVFMEEQQHEVPVQSDLVGDFGHDALDLLVDVGGVQQLLVDLAVYLLLVGRVARDQADHRQAA